MCVLSFQKTFEDVRQNKEANPRNVFALLKTAGGGGSEWQCVLSCGPSAGARKADPAAAPAPARQGRFQKSRRTDDWDPEVVRAAYKRRFPFCQVSLTDLPCPKAPDGWDPLSCVFCSEIFADRSTCTKHTMSCPQMPYDEWLRRVRICHHF